MANSNASLFELNPVRPWVDPETGLPNRVFVEWMKRLWERSGGVSSFTNSDLAALSAGVDKQTALRGEIDELRAQTAAFMTRKQTEIDDLQAQLLMLSRTPERVDELQAQLSMLTRTPAPTDDDALLALAVRPNDATEVLTKGETLTANATINEGFAHHYLDGTSAVVTATLPDPTVREGAEHILTCTNRTFAVNLSGHINGTASTTQPIYADESYSMKSDGATWRIHG